MEIVIDGTTDDRPGYGYEYHLRASSGQFTGGERFNEGKGCDWGDPYSDNPRPTTCDRILDGGRYVKGSAFRDFGDNVFLNGGRVTHAYIEFPDAPTTSGGMGIAAVHIGARTYTSLTGLAQDVKLLNPDGSRKECYGDSGCGRGSICEDNVCIEGCRTRSDCPGDQFCRDNECIAPCSTIVCPPDEECEVQNGQPVCVPTNGGGNGGGEGPDIPREVVVIGGVGIGLAAYVKLKG